MTLSAPILLLLALAMVSPWCIARFRVAFVAAGAVLHLGICGHYARLLVGVSGGGSMPSEKGAEFFPTDLVEWSFLGTAWGLMFAVLVSGIGLLVGFLLVGTDWGTHSLEAWRVMVAKGREVPVAALSLMLAGAATKSALFPFFFWLPNAMSAPTPVSSYLHSATMVKAGIFLIGALFPLFASSAGVMGVIVALGATTAVTGLVLGWVQADLKKSWPTPR